MERRPDLPARGRAWPRRPLLWRTGGQVGRGAARRGDSPHCAQLQRDATRSERAWNYAGAWLHWLYPLRGGVLDKYWNDTVVWLSILGIAGAITGSVVGVMRWRFGARYRNGRRTPYPSRLMRWHHISGLLFAAPLMESESSIEVLAPYESRSYVDMTVDAMQQFGVKVTSRARENGSVMYRVAAPQRYTASDFAVEGDYSQAAFLAVLGCVIGGITVTGLNPDSQQGDKVILDILKRCGGKFKPVEGGLHFDRSLLKATEIDLADCPDLGPILFTLGCFCSGETVIRNAGRLRLKESDRIEAMQTELRKMGARIEVDGDTVHIQGVALHAPNAPLSGHNDHRIVMALAVAAIASGLPALLCGAEAVDKSWPAFWSVLRGLGAKVELNTDKQEEFDIKA